MYQRIRWPRYIPQTYCTVICDDQVPKQSLLLKDLKGKKYAIVCANQDEIKAVYKITGYSKAKSTYLEFPVIPLDEDNAYKRSSTASSMEYTLVRAKEFISANEISEPECSCKIGEPYNNLTCPVHGNLDAPEHISELEKSNLLLEGRLKFVTDDTVRTFEEHVRMRQRNQHVKNKLTKEDFNDIANGRDTLGLSAEALGIAQNVKLTYELEYVHGEPHRHLYIDVEKLAVEIQSLLDTQVKERCCHFLDAIREYERESGNQICYDDRESLELFSIYKKAN